MKKLGIKRFLLYFAILIVANGFGIWNSNVISHAQNRIMVDDSEGDLQEGGLLSKSDFYVESGLKGAGSTFNVTAVRKKMIDTLMKGKLSVDLTEFNIPAGTEADTNALSAVCTSAKNACPDLFYIGTRRWFYTNDKKDRYIRVDFTLKIEDEKVLARMKKEYNSAVNGFMRSVDDSWTDMEKLIYINDYLDRICKYDTSISKENIYDAYGVMVRREAVCQGYALAVSALCKRLGVECYLVTSKTLNHAWNLVKINGKFYMLDVTWDDPTNDRYGRARHTYFLKSYSWFNSETGKHGAEDYIVNDDILPTVATDTKYNSYVWDGNYVGYEYIDGTWYGFYPSNSIYTFTCNGSDWELGEKIIDLGKSNWTTSDGGKYSINNCLSIASYYGHLFYTDANYIYKYDPETGDRSVLYTESLNLRKTGYIYGIVRDKHNLSYAVSATPAPGSDEKQVINSINLYEQYKSVITFKEPEFTWADDATTADVIFESEKRKGYDMTFEDIASEKTVKQATCENEGSDDYTVTITFNDKTYSNTKSVPIKALGHTGGVATCCKKAVCDRCHKEYGSLNAKNHMGDVKIKNAKDATSAVAGYTGDTYCSGCGAKLKTGKTLAKLQEGVGKLSADQKTITDTTGVKYLVTSNMSNSQLKQNVKVADKKTGGKYKITKVVKKSGKVTGGTVTYVKPYSTAAKNATVPEKVSIAGVKFSVTVIDNNAFKNCKKLSSIVVGGNIKKIGKDAFRNCKKLKKITFKTIKLENIGANAFKGISKTPIIRLPKKLGTSKRSKYIRLMYKTGVSRKSVMK